MNQTETSNSVIANYFQKHVEVQEFATLTKARTLIKVLHYRTLYTDQGEVKYDVVDSRALATRIILELSLIHI